MAASVLEDPRTGRLPNLARADIARFQQQVPEQLVPAWVQLQTEVPRPTGRVPRTLPPPELTEGPHFSYAVQWFIFSTIAVVGYPLILRRRERELARGDEDDDFDGTLDRPDPDDVPGPDDPRLHPVARTTALDLDAIDNGFRYLLRRVRGFGRRGLAEAHDQDRTGRVLQDVVADRSEQDPLQPAVAVRAEHHDVCCDLGGHITDRGAGLADLDARLGRHAEQPDEASELLARLAGLRSFLVRLELGVDDRRVRVHRGHPG